MDIAWTYRVGSFSLAASTGTNLLTCRLRSTCVEDLKHAAKWLKKYPHATSCSVSKTRGCDATITFTVALGSHKEKVSPVWSFLHERTLAVQNVKLQVTGT